jgi:hypothetical protein
VVARLRAAALHRPVHLVAAVFLGVGVAAVPAALAALAAKAAGLLSGKRKA